MADPTFALVVLEDRFDGDLLAERGVSTNDSNYDESGPGPGFPVEQLAAPDWTPVAVEQQDRAIRLRAIRAGFPGRDLASVAWRLETESDDEDWRGWDDPVLLTHVSTPDSDAFPGTGAGWVQVALIRLPGVEQLAMTACEAGAGEQQGYTWQYDPDQEAWRSSSTDWGPTSGIAHGLSSPIATVWDPDSERVVILAGPGGPGYAGAHWVCFESTDRYFESVRVRSIGWAPDGIVTPLSSGLDRLRVAALPGRDWTMFYRHTGDTATRQLLSSDRGATWSFVGSSNVDGDTTLHDVVAVGNTYVVGYVDASDDTAKVRILPSAATPFDDAPAIVIDSTVTAETINLAVDSDGILYAVYRDETALRASILHLSRSLDGGATWERYTDRITVGNEDSTGISIEIVELEACGGQLHVLTNDSEGLLLLNFGGWSNVEGSTPLHGGPRTKRSGWGGTDSAASRDEPRLFLMSGGSPVTQGWASTGTATAQGWDERGWYLDTVSVAGGPYYWTNPSGVGVNRTRHMAHGIFDLDTGFSKSGAFVASGGMRLRAVDIGGAPTLGWTLEINLYSDGFRVRDVHGAADLANVSVTLTDQPVHVRAQIEEGLASVWYRFVGDDKWTELVVDGSLTSSGGTLVGTLDWGLFGTSVNMRLYHRMIGTTDGSWLYSIQSRGALYDLAEDGVRGLEYGKALPAVGGYPCPGLRTPTFRQLSGYLRGGGFASGESVVRLPVRYQYPIGAVFPSSSPSPRRTWRAGNEDEVLIVWDWGNDAERDLGNVVALVVLNAAPRQWQLQINDSGWTTVGTLDLALGSSLTYEADGHWVRPASGTTDIDRYIHEGELVGGYFETASGAQVIVHNTAGYWSDTAGVQQVVLEIADGSGVGASGSDGVLVAPSGVAIFELDPTSMPRYVRVRAAGSQISPHDHGYQAGVIAVGRVVGVGAEPGWGWRRQVELTRELTRRTDELLEVRQTGPARTSLTYDWPDGVVLRLLNTLTSGDNEAVQYSGVDPIGTVEDAHSVVTGLIRDRMRQGEVPCVVIPRLPDLDDTLTDPYRWVYGRVRTDTHGITGVSGREGRDEVVRVDGITVEEIA